MCVCMYNSYYICKVLLQSFVIYAMYNIHMLYIHIYV